MSSTREKLRRLYACFEKQDRVLVMISADPDALASALTIKRLLYRRVQGVDICSINRINRPDNLAMIEFLRLKLIFPENIKKEDYSRFVIVDSQPSHNPLFQFTDYDVIIDHHPLAQDPAAFKDVRPEYGAMASIMTEYLKASGIKPSDRLATALFFGIKTDTHDFTQKAIEADIKAFRFIFKYVRTDLIYKIEHAEIRPDYLRYYQKAIRNYKTLRGKTIIYLGSVPTPDVCVMVADFFMKITTVNWCIVSGIFEDKLVVIFRSVGGRRDCGKLAVSAFSTRGSAGGHKAMARAEIPIDALKDETRIHDPEQTTKWLIRTITRPGK